MSLISVKNLHRTFVSNSIETHVLKGIDLSVAEGEFIAIMGRSGAGKSTFLYQVSLLDEPTRGEIVIDEINTHTMTAEDKTMFRLKNFGFVFQDYALLPELTAHENVVLPLLMEKYKKDEAFKLAEEALVRVRMGHRIKNLPSQLSGGEQQRVSIARAISNAPRILFADEPTANLDNESSKVILEIFTELNNAGQTILMVTHEEEFARAAKRIIKIDDGKVISDTNSL